MTGRMGIALLSLAGLFISLYLWLYKIGVIGTMMCGTGGCETVQTSPESVFLGVEVALIGVLGYAVLLLVALVGTTPARADARGPALALARLSGGAVAFTAYLKYLEFFVIGAVCRWCVASAVIILLVFLLSLLDLRRVRGAMA
ncbi:MAG: vitamin K epoxide reductase family protein [Gemmatimonadales bacterium]|nr:vitamin K epoxide reductase family protein [Gemmatimonadales bacterium]